MTLRRSCRCLPLLLIAAASGGCGSTAEPERPPAPDPAMAAALQAPLLVDPDLSQHNARNLAIVPPGPVLAPDPVASSGPD
eukprot:gene13231-13339_t